LADSLKKSGNDIDFEIAKWETLIFTTTLSHGEIQSVRMYDDKGDVHEFPDLKNVDDKLWSYLVERLEASENPILKARYSQILWCSPKKHADYAKTAIENYLLAIKNYEEIDVAYPQNHYGLKVLECFKNAYYLSSIVNCKFDEIKSEFYRLISSFNRESSSSPAIRTQLIKLALEDKKIFAKDNLASFDIVFEDVAGIWTARDNIRAAIDVYELAERWEMKNSGKNTGIWRRKIADSFESMMQSQLQNGNIAVALDFCIEAILSYKMIKVDEKVKELELIYQQNKDKVEFNEITQEIDLREHVQLCKDFAKSLLQHNSSEQIVGFLSSDGDFLLPKMHVITERVKELNETSLAHQLFPITTTDQQSNPAQMFTTDDQRFNHCVLEQYRIELEINKRILIQEVIFSAIQEGKLKTKDIIDFLKMNSWAGKTYNKKIGTRQITYNWIAVLAPAIDDYISQLNLYFDNNEYVPNFVLCIDSLTLKIEGLLRDFFSLQNISTSSFKQGGIVREKDLNELFADPKMTQFFSDDEIKFMRFLLIEQMGYNLRHRVAHSFMVSQEYGINYMNYLIITVLRICQFDFTRKTNSDESCD
jgi:hypothetical protein